MVYTKHKVVHSFTQLRNTAAYIKDEAKVIEPTNSYLENAFAYIADANKTEQKKMVSGHLLNNLNEATAAFTRTKYIAGLSKGKHLALDEFGKVASFHSDQFEKELARGKSTLAHHLIQSFSPDDDLTPDEVHEIGRQTVMELTGGNHQFVIATHLDKGHLHNHIIFNSTNSLTGNAFRWQKQTKQIFERISDKIASRYGAKIIEKRPGNNHAQYTKWQAQNIFKKKIKRRLDFLIARSNSKEDFLEKAAALSLEINDKGKHTKFRLKDCDQQQWTRARTLNKKDTDYYQLDHIAKLVEQNNLDVSVEDVFNEYIDTVQETSQDYTWRVEIEPFQIDSSNEHGLYLNVDFGVDRRGQVFVPGRYLDPLENGNYLFFLKDDDFFELTENRTERPEASFNSQSKTPRYMKGKTLVRQLSSQNGKKPVRKEPVLNTINDYLRALDFYASHGDGTLQSGQAKQIDQKLTESLEEAKSKLFELDQKIVDLKQEMAKDLTNPRIVEGYKRELDAIMESRDLLNTQYEQAVQNLDYYRGIESKFHNDIQEQNKKAAQQRGPSL